jgi:hypothetical protein
MGRFRIFLGQKAGGNTPPVITRRLKVYVGGEWVAKPLKYYNGVAWVEKELKKIV